MATALGVTGAHGVYTSIGGVIAIEDTTTIVVSITTSYQRQDTGGPSKSLWVWHYVVLPVRLHRRGLWCFGSGTRDEAGRPWRHPRVGGVWGQRCGYTVDC